MADKRRKTVAKTVAPKRVERALTSQTLATPATPATPVDARVEDIAARAYERFVARGGEHGRDVDDWLAAEAELRGIA